MSTEPAAKTEARAAASTLPRIKASDAVYGDILDFLIDEAALLDDDLHQEWLELLADDIAYKMPVRKTLYRRDGKGFANASFHFNDNKTSLALRVKRSVAILTAFDRDPAPRIRRMVSNVVVREGGKDEYEATSSILMLRNRFDDPTYDILTGRREDLIRRTGAGFKLARRTVLLDQAGLGASYLNVFM
jgi:3-phenylpropionate/cinnamic acid dioxygenase small subunit